jgi:protein-S-isoprenylcysteine O-methyltransferase Ste14
MYYYGFFRGGFSMNLPLDLQIWLSGSIFLLAGGVILPQVRQEYLRRGGLNQPVAFLQLVVWFLFHVFLGLVVWGDLWPSLPALITRNWYGGLLALFGLGLCLAGMASFHSLRKITGRQADRLVISGVYRWTRNPQYTGYGLVILGVVLGYWSATAWLALPAFALLAYVTVRIEEEHLGRFFGEQYRSYCRQVPRFIDLRLPGKPGP